METKTCTKCKQDKLLSAFNKKASQYDGLNPWCKECISNHRKKKYYDRKAQGLEPATAQWQRDNRDKLNTIRTSKRRAIRDRLRGYKNVPCEMCGQRFPPVCMDFDHLDPNEKEFNLGSDAIREMYSFDKISEEVSKCRIICANCHRIHSAMQRGEDPLEWGL